ncbi:MAG: NAD(P)-dependent oxidoreductase [Exilispira sp.]
MNILIYEQISPSIIERIKELGHNVYDISQHKDKEDQYLPICELIIIKSRTILSKDIISRAKNLKFIIKGGVSIDNIDIDYAHNLGIHVLNTPDAPIISVAEYTIGLILAIVRNIPQSDKSFKEGNFAIDQFKGHEIYGKTLGVVGFGRIGREVAKRALAFGMKVIACDKYLFSSPMPDIPLLSLDQLLKKSDIITFHLTFDPSKDKPIIEAREFQLMKDGVILVNCAKNGIINEVDLAEAIRKDKIGGLAIDVLNINSSLFPLLKENPRIIATTNLAAKTFETDQRISEHIFTIIKGLEQK